MRRMLLIMMVTGLIVVVSVSDVYGSNTQGLEWGVEGGDRLDYYATYYSIYPTEPPSIPPNLTVHERVYVIFNPLGPLPDTVTRLDEVMLDLKDYTLFYENGSGVGWPMGAGFSAPILAFPVGNWPLIAGLWDPDPGPGRETIDNESMWGRRWEGNGTLYHYRQANIYSKADGVFYQYMQELRDKESGELIALEAFDRVENSTDTSTTTSGTAPDLTVSIALGSTSVVVIVAALLVMRRPRSSGQPEGSQ